MIQGEQSPMNTVSALTSLPLSVTIIGAAFAIVIFNHYFSGKHRPHELVWGIAFLLFSIAAACQVLADLNGGWNPALARTYYLTGAILNVTLLGLGTAYLLLRRPIAHVALVLTVLLAVVSVYVLLTVPIDTSALGQS